MDLRKILGRPDASDEEIAKIEAMLAAQNVPARKQHYLFVHRFLPGLTYQYGMRVAILLGHEEDGPPLLRRMWDDAGEGLPPEHLVEPEPLAAFTHMEGEYLYTIITVPQPTAPSEAHFAAIVAGPLPPPPVDESPEALQAGQQAFLASPVQYFTLEHGVQLNPLKKRTVFCSWTIDGKHMNFGDGPEPTAEAFLAHLQQVARHLPDAQGSFDPSEGRVRTGEQV